MRHLIRPLASFFLLALVATAPLAGCNTMVIMADRSAFTARPLDALPPVGPVDVEALQAEHPGVDAVYLRVERSMEHLFYLPENGNWDFVDDRRGQYVVLDPEEEQYTTLKIGVEDGGQLEGLFARVTNPDGTVRTFTHADMIEERDDDGRVYSFAYPGIERGSVIEESFRIRYRYSGNYYPPLSHDVALQFDVPIDSLKVRYVSPETWALQFKQIGPNRMPPFWVDRESEAGKTMVVYESAHVPAIPDEPYAPFFKEMANYLEFQVTEIYVRGEKIFETPKSWDALAERFKRYAFQSGALFSDPAARAAFDVVPSGAPDLEKLERIVDWVQQNITLDGGSSADNFVAVLRAGRGDRYTITGLAQAMLDRAGLPAEYLLIHAASEGFFDRTYIHSSQLYIPAIGVEVDGEAYVVFPYLEGLPINYIPEPYQGQSAMRITADGFGGFTTVPSRSGAEYATDENYTIRIDEEGVLTVEEEQVLRGAAAYLLRKELEDEDEEACAEILRERLTYTDGEIQDFAYTVENEDDFKAPLTVRLTYAIDHLVTVTPVEVLFQTGGLLSPSSVGEFKVDSGERRTPLRIYNEEVTNRRIVIEHPEGWTLTTELADAEDRNRFGDVQGSYAVAPGRIEVSQRVQLRPASATPNRYGQLIALVGSSSRLNVPTLVFEAR